MRYQFVDCRWTLGEPGQAVSSTSRGTSPARATWTSTPTCPLRPGPKAGIRCRRGRLRQAAGRAGIGDGVFVVAYGNMGGAERLWWLLRHFGHDDCAVIDFESWRGPLASGEEEIEAADFVPARAPRRHDHGGGARGPPGRSATARPRRATAGALPRRAEPDRPRARPHSGREERALHGRAPEGSARGRRGGRLLRFGRDRDGPAPQPRSRGRS